MDRDEVNPYRTPDAERTAANTPDEFPVEMCATGRCVVVRDGAVLPPRCVVTGEPLSPDAVQRHRLEVALPTEFFPRKIEIVFGMSRDVEQFYKFRRAFQFLTSVLILVLATFGYMYTIDHSIFMIAMIGCAIFAGLSRRYLRPLPLRVIKRQHDRYWIAGCGPAFLDYLKQQKRNPDFKN